jgi:hypothetical protein
MLDSWMFPLDEHTLDEGSISAPTLFLSSSLWNLGSQQVVARTRYSAATQARGLRSFTLKCLGTDHQNFSDLFLLCFSGLLPGLGSLDPFLFADGLNEIVCKFFEKRNSEIDSQEANNQTCVDYIFSSLKIIDPNRVSCIDNKSETARLTQFLYGSDTLGMPLMDRICVDDAVESGSELAAKTFETSNQV